MCCSMPSVGVLLVLVLSAVCVFSTERVDAVAATPSNLPSGPTVRESIISVKLGGSLTIPFPSDLPGSTQHIGVLFFGDYHLFTPDQNGSTEIQSDQIFLHHLFLWNQTKGKTFFAGCSDERSTWGPHFAADKYLTTWHRQDVISGSISLSKLKSPFQSMNPILKIRVRYYLPEEYPENAVEASGLYVLRSADVPVHDEGIRTFAYAFENPLRSAHNVQRGEILYFVGHLHVGGISLDLTVDDNLVCKSEVVYTEQPCFIECPTKECSNVWNAVDTILPCVGMQTEFTPKSNIRMLGHYNATCHFSSVHAQGAMWWAPL